MEENIQQTYKFTYSGKCEKEPLFPKEMLCIATERDRRDLENINFFEDGEIDEFLKNSSIYILRINGEYIGLGTILIPTWRTDIVKANIRDIGMHIVESHRGKGIGQSIAQNLIAICIENGQIPAAECLIDNQASRATLERAGFI